MWLAKPYSGISRSYSFISRSLVTLAMMLAAAMDTDLASPFIIGTRCGSRENISTENGGIYFTEKEGQRFVILDGLKKGDTTLTIPGMEGRVIPLDASVQAESKETPDGLEMTVKDYDRSDSHVLYGKRLWADKGAYGIRTGIYLYLCRLGQHCRGSLQSVV